MTKSSETTTPIFDLFEIDTSKAMNVSSPCEIKHPTSKIPTGAIIHMFGVDSDKVTSYINQQANSQLAKEAFQAARNKEPAPATVEKSIDRQIELLIVATDKWENVAFKGEHNVAFSVAVARELYRVKFVREQIQEFIGDIENFMKG